MNIRIVAVAGLLALGSLAAYAQQGSGVSRPREVNERLTAAEAAIDAVEARADTLEGLAFTGGVQVVTGALTTVSFGRAFDAVPFVSFTPAGGTTSAVARVITVTASNASFAIRVTDTASDSTSGVTSRWFAIGIDQ